MFNQDSVKRLDDKSPLHAIQIELQQGYELSPVEAQVLAHRLQAPTPHLLPGSRRCPQLPRWDFHPLRNPLIPAG